MPLNSTIHRMTAYMAWADDVTLKYAENHTENELSAPRDTLFGTITGTFDHILVIGEIFKAHLEGHEHRHTARSRPSHPCFAEVAERLREIDAWFVAMACKWSTKHLSDVIEFSFVDGGQGVMTREDILLHLVNHSTYHRGFVKTLLFPVGKKDSSSDLTVFLRDIWHSDKTTHWSAAHE